LKAPGESPGLFVIAQNAFCADGLKEVLVPKQQVADEPVLVINPLPVKAGDRLEDKTKGTVLIVLCQA